MIPTIIILVVAWFVAASLTFIVGDKYDPWFRAPLIVCFIVWPILLIVYVSDWVERLLAKKFGHRRY